MQNLQVIKDALNNHKQHLFRDYPIKSIAIFGSYSRRENNNNSDIDILVEFKDKIGIRFIDLADELENILGSKVDLVSKKGMKEKYLNAIDSDLIYV